MKKYVLAFCLLLAIYNAWYILTPYPAVQSTQLVVVSPTAVMLNSEKLLSLVNEWRTGNNLLPFTKSENLCKISNERVAEIKTDFSHDNFLYNMKKETYCKSCFLGENIARQYSSEEEVLQDWLNSPTHRENLTGRYSNTCISTDGTHAVQIFGSL